MRLIAFPLAESRICGWPDTVRLTDCESRALEQVHLGGMAALRTERYRCACATVDSLARKGLLDRDGPTALGRRIGQLIAESQFQEQDHD